MKIAHIVPPEATEHVAELMMDYHLLLPELVKRAPDYRKLGALEEFKVLDNGVAEGIPWDFKLLLKMGHMMDIQELVLPDVMGDMEGTLKAVADVAWLALDERRRFRYMFVVQGKNVAECVHSAQRAVAMFPNIIHTFGIPRHIMRQGSTARVDIATRLKHLFPDKQIHLLGMHPQWSGEIEAFARTYANLGVRGVDSSLAWNAAMQGVPLNGHSSLMYNLTIERQPIGEFATVFPTRTQLILLRDNMEAMNAWIANIPSPSAKNAH